MKSNVGDSDAIIRIIIGASLIGFWLMNTVSVAWSVALFVAAGALLITSLASFCPFYWLLKLNTYNEELY